MCHDIKVLNHQLNLITKFKYQNGSHLSNLEIKSTNNTI